MVTEKRSRRGQFQESMIGDGVLIGAGTCILGNIKIGDGAKIGAGSVVIKDVPPRTTAVGNPAKLVAGKNNPIKLDKIPSFTMDHTSNISEFYDYLDLKPSLISVHQENEIPLSMDTTHKQETNSKCLVQKDIGSSPQVSQVQEAEEEDTEAKALAVNNIEIKDNDDCNKEEEEDDELKRRVEEFIEKVNRG
ncbi:hypothetical protein RIF29_16076 [Crotalaria pallida]|uniref:Serine O-acetyltransferase n=1 Tax=Crotalaria pallida TaxID=3830 RepID=A0AAN9IBQ3_CROPI